MRGVSILLAFDLRDVQANLFPFGMQFMESVTSVEILQNAVLAAATLATPLLVVSLVVGFLVSLLQAVTQIQDQTVSAVPKIIAIVLALVLFLPWMTDFIVEYTRTTYQQIPDMIRP